MTSPLVAAQDWIRQQWEAITPPTDGGRPFRLWLEREQPEPGLVSGHRAFVISPPARSGTLIQMSDSYSWVPATIAATVYFNLAGLRPPLEVSTLADEGRLLRSAINHASENSWPAGVQRIECVSDIPVDLGPEQAAIVFAIELVTEET